MAIIPLAAAAGRCPEDGPSETWTDADTRASLRILDSAPAAQSVAPRLVIGGSNTIVIVDPDDAREPRKIETRGTLAAAPRIDVSAAEVVALTCDGWLARVDLARAALKREVRAGSRATDLAVAATGAIAVALAAPPGLALFGRDLGLLRGIPGRDVDGKRSAAPVLVADARARRSFIALLPAIAELWEVSYDPSAPDIAAGMVHDFQFREGALVRGYLNTRRIRLPEPGTLFGIDPHMHEALVTGGGSLAIVDLDVRKRIAGVAGVASHPERALAWRTGGTIRVAVPTNDRRLIVLEGKTWQTMRTIETPALVTGLVDGGDRLLLWSDASDAIQTLDKSTLALHAPLRPQAGRMVRALEFDAARAMLYVATGTGEGGALAAVELPGGRERWRIAINEPQSIARWSPPTR